MDATTKRVFQTLLELFLYFFLGGGGGGFQFPVLSDIMAIFFLNFEFG
jgi:hypothetical protein